MKLFTMKSIKLNKGIIAFLVMVLIAIPCFPGEMRSVELTGRYIQIGDDLQDKMAAVVFSVPEYPVLWSGWYWFPKIRPTILGRAKNPHLSRISGFDHDVSVEAQKPSGVPGVAANVPVHSIYASRVTITGQPPIKGDIEDIDLSYLVDYLKPQADYYIEEDTIYKGGVIGSEDDYKIVVVDGARLTLAHDFKGYGVLILTGERKDNPIWDDEEDDCDIDYEYDNKLHKIFQKLAVHLGLRHPHLPRVRRRVRLVMSDTAAWHGLIISDLGADVEQEWGVEEVPEILHPPEFKKQKQRGFWKYEWENEKLKKKYWNKDKEYMDQEDWNHGEDVDKGKGKGKGKGHSQIEKVWEFVRAKVFSIDPVYACEITDREVNYDRWWKHKKFKPHPRLRARRFEHPRPKWVPGGVIIILGRQPKKWHPPYPFPLILDKFEEVKLEAEELFVSALGFQKAYAYYKGKRRFKERDDYGDDDENYDDHDYDKMRKGKKYDKLRERISEKIDDFKKKKRKKKHPQPGDGVQIYGSVMLAGSHPVIVMGLADIFYSQEAISKVNERFMTTTFVWEEWKERE